MERREKHLAQVRTMADYQFGKGCGVALFPDDATFQLSKTKRVRQILHKDKRIATVRARDGTLTLSMYGAGLVKSCVPKEALKVVVCEDAVPFVSKGKTAFAKHVVEMDQNLRAGEEVLVVDESNELIATGQLLLSPDEISVLDKGGAVDIRRGKNQ
ncbi:MAG TPA: pseudouridine synthase [Methanosarcinaceae archaeon]|nr:pseudouridine synthase [Methanosarcinaceae archaeon]